MLNFLHGSLVTDSLMRRNTHNAPALESASADHSAGQRELAAARVAAECEHRLPYHYGVQTVSRGIESHARWSARQCPGRERRSRQRRNAASAQGESENSPVVLVCRVDILR